MIGAAIFDLDGTLVTFNFDVKGSRRAMLQELARSGFDSSGLELSAPTQEILDAVKQQTLSGRMPIEFGVVRQRLFSILDEFEAEGSKLSRPFEGTKTALEKLRKNDVRLALLTNSGRAATSALLSRYRLAGYFEFVLTRDDVQDLKPSPSGIFQAVARFGLHGSRVYYVGDSVLDVIAAKKAGVSMVAVASGNYRSERLRAEGAKYVLDAISDLPGLLGCQ
jgi:HAD superfamily hydrolase (TIGR01549 family)